MAQDHLDPAIRLQHQQMLRILRWGVVAVWVTIALVTIGRVALMGAARHRGIYYVYQETGQHWLRGESVYADADGLQVFRYSPLLAATLTPLAVLPHHLAWLGNVAMRMVNLLVYLGGAIYWLRWAIPKNQEHTQRDRLILLLLIVPLSVSSLVDVQVNALTAGLMLLGLGAAGRGKWNGVAWAWALAILTKIFPIALAAVVALAFPRRLTWRLTAAVAVGLLAPFLLQQPAYVWDQYQRWIHLLALNDREGEKLGTWYRDIRLTLHTLGIAVSPEGYMVMQVSVATGIAALVGWMRSRNAATRDVLMTAFVLSSGWMMAFGPCTEQTTYIVLAPGLAWVTGEAWKSAHGRAWRILATALFLGFLGLQVALWFPGGKALHNLGPHGVGTVVLMIMAAVLGVRACQDSPSPVLIEPCVEGSTAPTGSLPLPD